MGAMGSRVVAVQLKESDDNRELQRETPILRGIKKQLHEQMNTRT
jgi:hypothetical protein